MIIISIIKTKIIFNNNNLIMVINFKIIINSNNNNLIMNNFKIILKLCQIILKVVIIIYQNAGSVEMLLKMKTKLIVNNAMSKFQNK